MQFKGIDPAITPAGVEDCNNAFTLFIAAGGSIETIAVRGKHAVPDKMLSLSGPNMVLPRPAMGVDHMEGPARPAFEEDDLSSVGSTAAAVAAGLHGALPEWLPGSIDGTDCKGPVRQADRANVLREYCVGSGGQ